ncbi:WD40 repeat-like protein, partial [Tilletiaria anomala UBC 951]
AGDSHGQVSVTSMRTYRQTAFWKAHNDSVLGVEMVTDDIIVTSGRDNELHVWSLSGKGKEDRGSESQPSATSLPQPAKLYTVAVNAMNYCRFSILACGDAPGRPHSEDLGCPEMLIAVPHTLESAYIDLLRVSSSAGSPQRLATALGKPDLASSEAVKSSRQAIVMALHLFRQNPQHRSSGPPLEKMDAASDLHLLVGYEDGRVVLWRQECNFPAQRATAHGGMPKEGHWVRRAPDSCLPAVLSLSLSPCAKFAISTGADDVLVRYELSSLVQKGQTKRISVYKTGFGGRACSCIRADSEVVAAGGWDGRIRVHAGSTCRQLAVLSYFKDTVQAIAYAPDLRDQHSERTSPGCDESDSDEGWDVGAHERIEEAYRWLAAGGKDGRIALWSV